jgi:hypothetical protein
MKFLSVWGGPLVIFLLFINFASQQGHRWNCGRYGMPHSITSADGRQYSDGTPLDPLMGLLVRNNCEEEFFLGMSGFIVVVGMLALNIARDTEKKRRQIAHWRQLQATCHR